MSSRTITVGILIAAALTAAPFAFAATGDDLQEGQRNPGSGDATRETQIIARTAKDTYGTRQSNLGAGGGAIYGCRSTIDLAGLGDPKRSTPCIRVNNLRSGKAFDFQSNTGQVIGVIQSGNSLTTPRPAVSPFVTNATGLALGLNADRVDGLQAAEIVAQAVAAARAPGAPGSPTTGGCPENTIAASGGCLETGPRAAANFANASSQCAQAGRRLPPPDVLLGARTADPINLGGGEMTADVTVTPGLAGAVTQTAYVTVSDAGALGANPQDDAVGFRCYTG